MSNGKLATLQLAKGRDKPVRNHHPWIFSGAIHNISHPAPGAGEIVDIHGFDGKWLARGMYSPVSQIRARILTWSNQEEISPDFWKDRLSKAIAARNRFIDQEKTNAYRLIFAESDGLPGIIADKYGDFLVVQFLAAGVDLRKSDLSAMLLSLSGSRGILEKSDSRARELEGLSSPTLIPDGSPAPEELTIKENGFKFIVDIRGGQKTGFYLDQRDNRQTVADQAVAAGKDILNVFAYTGGFAVYTAASGARSIVNVDESAASLVLAQRNIKLNKLDSVPNEYLIGDAFKVLRQHRDNDRRFDLVILDPPKFAQSKSQVNAACRGYKDLNWLALRLLNPEGILATFSCSGLVSEDLFQKVVFAAAEDAGRSVQIIKRLGQPPDHPVLLSFPESSYLKGFLCRVL